jgi:hypothetical protein
MESTLRKTMESTLKSSLMKTMESTLKSSPENLIELA